MVPRIKICETAISNVISGSVDWLFDSYSKWKRTVKVKNTFDLFLLISSIISVCATARFPKIPTFQVLSLLLQHCVIFPEVDNVLEGISKGVQFRSQVIKVAHLQEWEESLRKTESSFCQLKRRLSAEIEDLKAIYLGAKIRNFGVAHFKKA
jgi:hypothetical protein